MKYLLVLSCLFLSACFCDKNKLVDRTEYKYNQTVMITGGFYQGQVGRVSKLIGSFSDCYKYYHVKINQEEFVGVCNDNLNSYVVIPGFSPGNCIQNLNTGDTYKVVGLLNDSQDYGLLMGATCSLASKYKCNSTVYSVDVVDRTFMKIKCPNE